MSTSASEQVQSQDLNEDELTKIKARLGEIGIKDHEDFDQLLNNLFDEIAVKDQSLADRDNLVHVLMELVEYYEFSYLNLHLVFNAKAVLQWFSRPSTKDLFMRTYPLPPEILAPLEQKEIIFNELLTSRIIVKTDQDQFVVSPKGERFLKFIGF